MKAKLGIAPIAWSNDDLPELGGETSLDTCLSVSQNLLDLQVWKQVENFQKLLKNLVQF